MCHEIFTWKNWTICFGQLSLGWIIRLIIHSGQSASDANFNPIKSHLCTCMSTLPKHPKQRYSFTSPCFLGWRRIRLKPDPVTRWLYSSLMRCSLIFFEMRTNWKPPLRNHLLQNWNILAFFVSQIQNFVATHYFFEVKKIVTQRSSNIFALIAVTKVSVQWNWQKYFYFKFATPYWKYKIFCF